VFNIVVNIKDDIILALDIWAFFILYGGKIDKKANTKDNFLVTGYLNQPNMLSLGKKLNLLRLNFSKKRYLYFSTYLRRYKIKKHLLKEMLWSQRWPNYVTLLSIYEEIKDKQIKLACLAEIYGSKNEIVLKYQMNMLHNQKSRIIAIENLSKSSNSKISGYDGESLRKIGKQRMKQYINLEIWLHNCIRKPALYRISFIRKVWMPKSKNKITNVDILILKDRVLQQLFKIILEPLIELKDDPYNFGYRNGRSPKNAIALLKENLKTNNNLKKNHNMEQSGENKMNIKCRCYRVIWKWKS